MNIADIGHSEAQKVYLNVCYGENALYMCIYICIYSMIHCKNMQASSTNL